MKDRSRRAILDLVLCMKIVVRRIDPNEVAVLTIVTTASSVAGTSGTSDAESGEDESISAAESYADGYGVSEDEAGRRLELQHELIAVAERVLEAAPDDYAATWISHDDDFQLIIRYSSTEVPAEAVDVVTESDLPIVLEAGAPYSLEETDVIVGEASQILFEHGVEAGVGYDLATGEFVLDMIGDPTDDNAIEIARASLPDELPAEIAHARINLISDQSIARRGGLDTRSPTAGGNCTTGFVVQNANGLRGVMTSAHCADNREYKIWDESPVVWYPMTFAGERRTGTQDHQWHTIPGHALGAWMHGASLVDYNEVDRQVLRASQGGMYVCHRGRTTGWSCGTVNSISYAPPLYNCNTYACAPVHVRVGPAGGNLRCDLGDSGGPVVRGPSAWTPDPYVAFGILKTRALDAFGNCAFFTHNTPDYFTVPLLFY